MRLRALTFANRSSIVCPKFPVHSSILIEVFYRAAHSLSRPSHSAHRSRFPPLADKRRGVPTPQGSRRQMAPIRRVITPFLSPVASALSKVQCRGAQSARNKSETVQWGKMDTAVEKVDVWRTEGFVRAAMSPVVVKANLAVPLHGP